MLSRDKHTHEMSLKIGDLVNREEKKWRGERLKDGNGYTRWLERGWERGRVLCWIGVCI